MYAHLTKKLKAKEDIDRLVCPFNYETQGKNFQNPNQLKVSIRQSRVDYATCFKEMHKQ